MKYEVINSLIYDYLTWRLHKSKCFIQKQTNKPTWKDKSTYHIFLIAYNLTTPNNMLFSIKEHMVFGAKIIHKGIKLMSGDQRLNIIRHSQRSGG